MTATLALSRQPLSLASLVAAARSTQLTVTLEPEAMAGVAKCRAVIDEAVARYRDRTRVDRDDLIYGVTSGFGEFKTIPIAEPELITLQRNILLSHSTGVGASADWLDAANYFPADVVRAALIIRLNAFLRGHSSVRPELARMIQAMLAAGVVPLVPIKGSLGSSGDLCPLAHLFAVLLGEGHFYLIGREPAPVAKTSRVNWMLHGTPVMLLPAAELWAQLHAVKLDANAAEAVRVIEKEPVSYKEGLALTNGATVSTAVLALAVVDAEYLANAADASTALTMESLCARLRFLDERVHAARGMAGQAASAANIRALIRGTRLCEWSDEVQDAYSIRCAPQVHGASRDAIAHAKMVVQAEINASTDNPLFLGDEPFGLAVRRDRVEQKDKLGDPLAYSAGNFHGQPVALAADFLSIGVAELANIAERRVQMLLDGNHNRNLPRNLIGRPGVNSGLMLAQYAAAALVSENKVLAHPASVDSIPTAANIEDHVAMAMHAARKARQVLENATAVIAIELLVAAQAVDWRTCLLDDEMKPMAEKYYYSIDPNRRSGPEQSVTDSPAGAEARAKHREAAFAAQKPGGASLRTIASLGLGTRAVYEAVRERVNPLHRDAVLEPMIRALRAMIADGWLVKAVNKSLSNGGQTPLQPVSASASAV